MPSADNPGSLQDLWDALTPEGRIKARRLYRGYRERTTRHYARILTWGRLEEQARQAAGG